MAGQIYQGIEAYGIAEDVPPLLFMVSSNIFDMTAYRATSTIDVQYVNWLERALEHIVLTKDMLDDRYLYAVYKSLPLESIDGELRVSPKAQAAQEYFLSDLAKRDLGTLVIDPKSHFQAALFEMS
jgi:hypothetical protein